MKLKFLLLSFLFCFFCGHIFSQTSDVKSKLLDVLLNYSEVHVLYSENVQDSFYIYIKLPKNYSEEKDKTYPAVFLLDGDIAFPIAYSVVRYLQFGRYVPDVLIVGIGYGGLMNGSKISKRERDYAISHIERWENSGSADNFLKFLKDELIPFLESNYRIDSNNRTLSGHSLGGLFALFTFFSDPQLFKNIIASSPYTSYDVDKLLSLEEKNKAEIEEADCKLFISFGETEDKQNYSIPNTKIVNQLKQRKSDYIDLKFRIFEEGVHFSTPAEAMAYGLIHAFSDK
jgi:predicted alpha/beta superfamily hydrolase